MRKTWIKVKRGLLEPKHRDKLGIRLWLYLHILDRANWKNGEIIDWVDTAESDQLEMPVTTLRKQRRQLEDDGYITATQEQHGQRITIHNWTDPRRYDEHTLNVVGDQKWTPTDGDKESQGDHQGDHQGVIKLDTPTFNSHITSHKSLKDSRTNSAPKKKPATPPAVELIRRITHRYPPKKLHDSIERKVGDISEEHVPRELLKLGRVVKTWIMRGYNPTNYADMIRVYENGWNHRGKAGEDPGQPKLTKGVRRLIGGEG